MSEYVTIWVDDLPDLKRGEEIVRCRDCKWFMSERKSETRGCFEILHPAFCNKHITNTEPDGFCSWGERRES